MFGFRKQEPAPPLCPGNPGVGVEAKIAFSTGDRNWTEKVDVVSLAQAVFKSNGRSVRNRKTWLVDAESGLAILPQLVGIQPLDGGAAQTVTTIQTNHPRLCPDGVFEYQHSTGQSVADSVAKGIDQWMQTDFVPLRDALRATVEDCTSMEMEFPAKDGKPARVRRAVLGPVAHCMQNPPPENAEAGPEEHPFCPCCLLTNSFKAFREWLEGDGFYGLRLFAARDSDGTPQADCRVNGEDWEKGAQALREYVTTWPEAGFEFRKQYVVLQTIEKLSRAAAEA